MEQKGTLHKIEDDLKNDWQERYIAAGINEVEVYLAKHLAFLVYVEAIEDDAPRPAKAVTPKDK